jgi:SpoIID/LytB domain protein
MFINGSGGSLVSSTHQPSIKVGLAVDGRNVNVDLSGAFSVAGTGQAVTGSFVAHRNGDSVILEGSETIGGPSVHIVPSNLESCRFTVHGVTIGVDFHWQRRESQDFQGALLLLPSSSGVSVINELPLESYLISSISSEMNATCPTELLKAHAIVSRSWLLAQLARTSASNGSNPESKKDAVSNELIRWYDRESHSDFDVCADDHCQRYQGISKAFTQSAFQAVNDTRGQVLTKDGDICDTRYSKCCGGVTEVYRAAWEDIDVSYLSSIYDGEAKPEGYRLPLSTSTNAEAWIVSMPPAYCNTNSRELLTRILPNFDQETTDFYRWEVTYSQEELKTLVQSRLGRDLGRIKSLEPLERGESGRIIRLRIEGDAGSLIIGKELEIRRALSQSHLYSSAFVVQVDSTADSVYPGSFRLLGAGWGHGVGLCQIGAAVMAELGHDHQKILLHYFHGASLKQLY